MLERKNVPERTNARNVPDGYLVPRIGHGDAR
jgi:hypothetical protein